jgi:hypothetical protein
MSGAPQPRGDGADPGSDLQLWQVWRLHKAPSKPKRGANRIWECHYWLPKADSKPTNLPIASPASIALPSFFDTLRKEHPKDFFRLMFDTHAGDCVVCFKDKKGEKTKYIPVSYNEFGGAG